MPNIKFTEMPGVGTGLDPNAIVPLVQTSTNYTITAANLQAYINTTSGNITAGNFIGNGSQLSSITAGNIIGTVANATYATSAGSTTNATHATTADTANVAYSVAAANIVGTVANATYADTANAANFATSATSAGTATYVTAAAQANITSVGALTALTVTGNATIGNVGSTNLTASGNVTGAYIIGNGSQLTGLPAVYANANVATYLASGTLNSNIITTANIAGTYFIGNGSQLTGITASGSTYGNSNVVSLLSAYGSNTISTTGNVTAGYFVGNGSALTGIVASAGTYISNGNSNVSISSVNGPIRLAANGGAGFGGSTIYIDDGSTAGGNINMTAASGGYINAGLVKILGSQIQSGAITTTTKITAAIGGNTAPFNGAQATKTGTSAGTVGDICWDSNYIYVCTSSNVWKRVALSSF
jgi:hypothetical protein